MAFIVVIQTVVRRVGFMNRPHEHGRAMSRIFTCEQMPLVDLLDGELSGDVEQSTLDHLDHCTTCRQRLEGLAGQPQWWDDTQRYLQSIDTSDPPSFRSIDRSNANPLAEHEPASEGPNSPSIELVRPLLGPSDDPQSLGRLGHYEVRSWIGAGATGIVMKAFDPRLHRFVAIKVLTPALLHNAAARLRFEREGRAMASIVHPHVVPVYSVDEYRGVPYIVMQLVTGGSLQRRIDLHGPLGLCETVRIALQTARGLSAAHDQGLVHRDIKPANILLEPQIERVVVTDFSLARVADEAQLTLSGIIAGTPPYMAPEQARGETLDARSDLFSLGSVIYAMCTGRPPFWSEGVLGTLRQVCEHEPKSVREWNPETPVWLEQLIAKLHEKDPAHRFSSATELATILEQELAHLQSPHTTLAPARPWLRSHAASQPSKRRRAAIVVGTVAAAVIATFGIGLTVSQMPNETQTPQAHQHQQSKRDAVSNPLANTGSRLQSSDETHPFSYSHSDLLPIQSGLNQMEASLRTPALPSTSMQWHEEVTRLSHDIDQLLGSTGDVPDASPANP